MTKLLRLSDGSWPRSRDDLQATYPLTAFPADPSTMAATDLAEFDYCVPVPTPAPIPSSSERVEEVHPVLVAGQWRQAWQLVALPPAPPAPDWEQLRSALRSENGYSSAFAAAFQSDAMAGIQLVAALADWQGGGRWELFLQALLAALDALPAKDAAKVATEFLALGNRCHLDPAFLTALEAMLNESAS